MKLGLLFLALSSLQAFAQGVFVYKNQNFHSDASAHAFIYSSVSVQEPVTWVTKSNGKLCFEKNQFHDWIPLMASLPDNISTETEILNFRKEVERARVFYDRYPRAQPLMKEVLNSMNQAILKIDSDQRRYQKDWISLDKYQAKLKEIEQEMERLKAEDKAREVAMIAEKKARELAVIAEKKAQELEKQAKEEELKAEEIRQAEAIRQKREMQKEQRISVAEQKIMSVRDEIKALEVRQSVFIEKLNNLLNSR